MKQSTYTCQRCSSSLVLHESLENLTQGQLNLLVNKNASAEELRPESQPDVDPTQFIPKDRLELYQKVSRSNPQPIVPNMNQTNRNDQPSSSLTSNLSYVMVSEESADFDTQLMEGESQMDKQQDNGVSTNESHPEASKAKPDDRSNTISARVNTLSNIFTVLSKNQDIDHPLCSDCSNLLIENFKLKYDQSQKEKEYYLTFLKKLKDREHNQLAGIESDDLNSKLANSIDEYKMLQVEEKKKLDELRELVDTKNKLDRELSDLNHELQSLNKNELTNILQFKNSLNLQLRDKAHKLEQSKALYQSHLNNLDKLRTLNIYNKFFNISFVDDLGTINGFRIGYKVPWSEVNSALGQIVLLLIFLVNRLNCDLVNYKLIPMGSKSQIVKISYAPNSSDVPNEASTASTPDTAPLRNNSSPPGNNSTPHGAAGSELAKSKTTLNLYSSNEFSLGKLFNFNKLDVSMFALLDILARIEAKLVDLNQDIELPYAISAKRDSIGGKSIRVASNGEWTQSCKNLLTNLNWILAYTSANTSPRPT